MIEESFVEKDVVHLLVQILEGLCFLHESNIVHLDLKVSCLPTTHTHAHTHTHACTHACTRTHTHAHSLTHIHTHTHSLSLSFPCPSKSPYNIAVYNNNDSISAVQICARGTILNTHTHARMHARTHTLARTHARTHTHTHTQLPTHMQPI